MESELGIEHFIIALLSLISSVNISYLFYRTAIGNLGQSVPVQNSSKNPAAMDHTKVS